VLNSWPIAVGGVTLDWLPTNSNESFGYNVLARVSSTLLPYTSSDLRIGYVGSTVQDYRMSVSAGPLRLQPGDSAVVRVAVILAAPVPGTFVSTKDLPPGNPMDPNRAIVPVAGNLFTKAAGVN